MGPAEAQHILYRLRDGIAQDLAALSLHLYVLQERAESVGLASTIADLRRIATGALDDTIALASFVEETTGSRISLRTHDKAAVRRIGNTAE